MIVRLNKTRSTRYEYWQHGGSGEVWAVRLDPSGDVTGSCGPLHYSEYRRPELLPDYHYDDAPEDADWVQEHEREFSLHKPA